MNPEGTGKSLDLWEILKGAHPISQIVFAILVGCFLLSIAVMIERWIVISRAKRSTQEAIDQLDRWSQSGQWETARTQIRQAVRQTSPMFSVLRAGIVYWQELVAVGETRLEVMEALVSEQVHRELRLVRSMLRANLPILANITSVAPFIGLFGTVVGIILTFQAISVTGNMGQELIASGIADALIATALGLAAAIPAVLAYNYFVDRVNQLILTMEEDALERIYFLVQREQVEADSASGTGTLGGTSGGVSSTGSSSTSGGDGAPLVASSSPLPIVPPAR